jgi:hypothetical protein
MGSSGLESGEHPHPAMQTRKEIMSDERAQLAQAIEKMKKDASKIVSDLQNIVDRPPNQLQMQQLHDLIVDLDKVIPILTEGNEDVGPKIRSQGGKPRGPGAAQKRSNVNMAGEPEHERNVEGMLRTN